MKKMMMIAMPLVGDVAGILKDVCIMLVASIFLAATLADMAFARAYRALA